MNPNQPTARKELNNCPICGGTCSEGNAGDYTPMISCDLDCGYCILAPTGPEVVKLHNDKRGVSDWHYLPELPEEGEAVLCDLGAGFIPMEYAYVDEDAGWQWVPDQGHPDYNEAKEIWECHQPEWDDDYEPIRWHRYPDPRVKTNEP